MLEGKMFTVLIGANAVTTIVGDRIFPVLLPQGVAFPSITYQRVSGDREYNLSGYSTLENPRIQIDIWSTSYGISKDLGGKVKTAMDAATTFKSIMITDQDMYEDEIKIYRVSQDYSIWNRE